jgi:hypothetical protein
MMTIVHECGANMCAVHMQRTNHQPMQQEPQTGICSSSKQQTAKMCRVRARSCGLVVIGGWWLVGWCVLSLYSIRK